MGRPRGRPRKTPQTDGQQTLDVDHSLPDKRNNPGTVEIDRVDTADIRSMREVMERRLAEGYCHMGDVHLPAGQLLMRWHRKAGSDPR